MSYIAKNMRLILAGAIALIAGIAIGIPAYASNSDSRAVDPAAEFADGKYLQDLPQDLTLGNGQSAGFYRPETPIDERPVYQPVTLRDGGRGFIKNADTFEVPYLPISDGQEPGEMDSRAMEALSAQHARVAATANGAGEIWVSVYAEDGTTVIGSLMVADGVEPRE